MRALTDMMHKHGGPRGIRLKDARLRIELAGNKLKMLPAGGNDILYLRAGPNNILHT